MGFTFLKKNKVIFSNYFLNNFKINYFDIGAYDDISSLWNILENRSNIYGFEPNSNEIIKLNSKFKKRKYFNTALWSSDCKRNVFINEWESTSSMYPPNTNYIKNFNSKHHLGRCVKEKVKIDCTSLDKVLQKENIVPDFIKIDTQGSELEILKGSKSILEKHFPIVTCETWCAEVYKDIPLMHEVISYMHSVGYQIFNVELAAAWRHGNNQFISSKQKTIGFEIFFVKTEIQPDEIKNNFNSFIKFLSLLELFGYRDYVVHLLEKIEFQNKNAFLSKILINNKKELRSFYLYINKLLKYFGFEDRIYPKIAD